MFSLFDWKDEDDPWAEHVKFSPECPHLVRCKMEGRFGSKVIQRPFIKPGQLAGELKEKGAAIADKADNALRWLFGVKEPELAPSIQVVNSILVHLTD